MSQVCIFLQKIFIHWMKEPKQPQPTRDHCILTLPAQLHALGDSYHFQSCYWEQPLLPVHSQHPQQAATVPFHWSLQSPHDFIKDPIIAGLCHFGKYYLNVGQSVPLRYALKQTWPVEPNFFFLSSECTIVFGYLVEILAISHTIFKFTYMLL